MFPKSWTQEEEFDRLARLLNHATMLESSDLRRDKSWQFEVGKLLAGKGPATIKEQQKNLTADIREVLRALHNDPELVDSKWFWRRAHRALCQDDGIIGPGEDFIRQYRAKTEGGQWGEWRLLTAESWANAPKAEIQVRFAPAGKPFDCWELPASQRRTERGVG